MISEIDVLRFTAAHADGALVVDVREPHEWKAGHAPRATHVPLSAIQDNLCRIPRETTVLTVCRSGARSARAAKLLASQGYDVRNVAGGMSAWSRAGLPMVATGGGLGRIV